MAKPIKIRVPKIALEIIRMGHAAKFAAGSMSGTREAIFAEVEKIVQADRLALTDTRFREKYLAYIRNYWGGRSVGSIN